MRKGILIFVLLIAVMAIMAMPRLASAEDVAFTYNGEPLDLSAYDVTATVSDPDHFDKVSKWKISGGVKIEDLIRITDNLRIEATARKQLNDTSFDEGWEGEGLLVYEKTVFDLRDLFNK